jgi:hypothetical protein
VVGVAVEVAVGVADAVGRGVSVGGGVTVKTGPKTIPGEQAANREMNKRVGTSQLRFMIRYCTGSPPHQLRKKRISRKW